MSVLSDIFSSGSNPSANISALEADAKARQAAFAAEQEAAKGSQYTQAAQTIATPPPAPIGGPEVALQKLNEALGSGFESRYEPDTVASPFVQSALTSGRSKADDFIANMLKRGTLTESGRAGAVSALDKQTPTATSRLTDISNALLSADRAKLSNLANTYRSTAQQAPFGQEFDPSPYVSGIASAGQSQSSTFGDRFNASLPPGDLFDTSGVAPAGGGVTSTESISYDPYAQEGGKLTTGLGDTSSPPPSSTKRRTSIF